MIAASGKWARMRSASPPARPIERSDRLLVLAAHPDDETLGAGGLLAMAEAARARITVVVATDGGASHPHSRTHSPHDLAAVRRREVYAAIAVLAPSADVQLLGLPDNALTGHADELATALVELAADCTHVVTPWVGDRHPDHETCARVGAAAARKYGAQSWEYPVWAWHWGDPARGDVPADGMRRLELDDAAQAAKARAIACYASQCAPLSGLPGDETVLTPAMLEHFRGGSEIFYVSRLADASRPGYFDGLHEHDADPSASPDRFYEQRRRAAVLAALTRRRFRRVFEPGCGTGLLTGELARRCDELVAWDRAAAAVAATRCRLADVPGIGEVTVAEGHIPECWPAGRFDLVVLSEIGYYCADLAALVDRVDASLDDDGVVVACHWRHPADDHVHSAGAVHGALGANRQVVVSHVEEDFLLHVWSRSGRSVAVAEGMIDPLAT